jgi:uncharacterized protein (DUF927 family)
MKFFLFFLVTAQLVFAQKDNFEKEARALVTDLKMSLMKNLSEKIAKNGAVEAVSFCHANVKHIAKGAAKDRISKFEFGRTSHRVRNTGNIPQSWANEYLKEFEGKKKDEIKKTSIIHRLSDGKRIYMEPLYVEAKCLLCHGENISKNVSDKIQELYPQDKATGFKLGEFRGFVWVKEK